MNDYPRIALALTLSLTASLFTPALGSAQYEDEKAEPAPAQPAVATADPVAPAAAPASPQEARASEAAEEAPLTRFRLGAQANLVIPVGDYADAADVAIGGDLRFAWDLHENVGLTARAGYLHHFGTPNDVTMGFIPLMVGGEYRFFGAGSTPFVAAELGATIGFVTGSVSTPWGSASASDTDSSFAVAIGGGYRFGPVDVKAMLYAPDIDDLVGFTLSVGGDFARF